MISDWSGAALEYAFGLERPVLFVDVPKKINNPDYLNIGLEPVEIAVRSQIGEVVSPDRLSDVPAALDRLCENPENWREAICEVRDRLIYNVGSSAKVSADYIAKVADEARTASRV
jgi:YidC/Oxa1 family membrane protein insertase